MQTSQEKLNEFLRTVPPEQFHKDFGVRFQGYRVTVRRLLEAEWKDQQIHLRQRLEFIEEAG
jgi:hypothetical protein